MTEKNDVLPYERKVEAILSRTQIESILRDYFDGPHFALAARKIAEEFAMICDCPAGLDKMADLETRPTASADVVERLEAVARLIERRAPDGDDSVLMDEDVADQLAADIRAALSASPVQELVEASREAIVKAYIAGATDVHKAWMEDENEKPWGLGEPSFTEAAYDYADDTLRDQ